MRVTNCPLRKFQSTLPVRGATTWTALWNASKQISIHAPREGSDSVEALKRMRKMISIHAPREGSDRFMGKRHRGVGYFNPRSP